MNVSTVHFKCTVLHYSIRYCTVLYTCVQYTALPWTTKTSFRSPCTLYTYRLYHIILWMSSFVHFLSLYSYRKKERWFTQLSTKKESARNLTFCTVQYCTYSDIKWRTFLHIVRTVQYCTVLLYSVYCPPLWEPFVWSLFSITSVTMHHAANRRWLHALKFQI